jgi:hypothetical protein
MQRVRLGNYGVWAVAPVRRIKSNAIIRVPARVSGWSNEHIVVVLALTVVVGRQAVVPKPIAWC